MEECGIFELTVRGRMTDRTLSRLRSEEDKQKLDEAAQRAWQPLTFSKKNLDTPTALEYLAAQLV